MKERGRRIERMTARELAGRAASLAEQRRAYYDVLHDDPKFVRAFDTLFTALFPAFSKSLTAEQWDDAIRLSDAQGTTPDQVAKVNAFVQQWSLPPAYAFEVWGALYTAQYGERLRLRAAQGHVAGSFRTSAIRGYVEPFIYNPALDPQAEAKRPIRR